MPIEDPAVTAMRERLVRSDQLFDLADEVTGLSGRAGKTGQQAVRERLDSALVLILEAAKSAAFNEAREKHCLSKQAPEQSSTDEKEPR